MAFQGHPWAAVGRVGFALIGDLLESSSQMFFRSFAQDATFCSNSQNMRFKARTIWRLSWKLAVTPGVN